MTTPRIHLLIIKHGALGDVVRTSYFAGALRQRFGAALRLSWITAPAALPLLRFNPHIDDLWTRFDEAGGLRFDRVYSLDDEQDVVEAVMRLDAAAITGAVLDADGRRGYTDDAAEWFDMGLLSRFGKQRADAMKLTNTASHGRIFSRLFDVPAPLPELFGPPRLQAEAAALLGGGRNIGINPCAGGRWPSKELLPDELHTLARALLGPASPIGADGHLVLLGAAGDRLRNLALAERLADPRVLVPDTDDSVLRLAALIGRLDYLVSSDSLALHLGIAQRVPFLAFFAPTSAVEIDDFAVGVKVVSTAADYCSYRKDADNRSITAARILATMAGHRPDLFAPLHTA
ncbi:glycosyltransferase family 9 protein [Derxia gummosa]|uniref:Glycosyltransferase family 9 protein n=1 Tax=Derxia gummosa DSM 723 TaxID=1121388 RepID=A0A8B6X2W4_9BURK|nr:glycosyltransferase family 9 protein [Derxia gummosa]